MKAKLLTISLMVGLLWGVMIFWMSSLSEN